MILFLKITFWISFFIIFWANIGYQASVVFLGKIINKKNEKKKDYLPTVTIMVVAHNEEGVILDKLKNLENINYPKSRLNIIVSSDNSTDSTNLLVENYIDTNPEKNVQIYKVKKRMGKTNAQNEAQKLVKSEFLVMTDANSMLDEFAIKELMSSFSNKEISYVTGKLIYINSDKSDTSSNESLYWNLDLKIREIESKIQTITAGNGALYAVRNNDYYDFEPIKSHDSEMPIYFGLQNKRAIYNPNAYAYEKAGENAEDEFNRKVRMNRLLLEHILPSFDILKFWKYGWFTYFYIGHRTLRYLLWFAHLLLLLSNMVLASLSNIYLLVLIFHLLIIGIAIVQHFIQSKNKAFNIIYYYCLTILAQYIGIIKVITGKAKPFWDKAESTR